MSKVELLMPKMGESIIEATILKWVKKVGDTVKADETILEIATDKVDSEIPSPTDGTITEILFPEDSVVAIGSVIAIISTSADGTPIKASPAVATPTIDHVDSTAIQTLEAPLAAATASTPISSSDDRFYSPLVRSIAKEENVTQSELDSIIGTGANGRVNKQDILAFIQTRASGPTNTVSSAPPREMISSAPASSSEAQKTSPAPTTPAPSYSGAHEIIEMDRMRKLIADHMVMSKHTSPHVTSFVEADVTPIVLWREKNKAAFKAKYGENITFTPIFIQAVVRAIKDFPMINVSVDGNNIIVKKDINIGMAAALPSGNLIVPVVKNADYLNLAGLAKSVNDLATRARENKLKPDEIKDGTFTLTNVGTFGNVMGTPIINQPQVAILATGAIKKKPAVLELAEGDVIAIRHMMFLSLSYDHRVVDGSLGGSFLRRVADYLEQFDINTTI
jgi:2-oxoglutarate dehydrogenase E2 component (dihydrolipoamide succinyltransferase)